MDLGTQGAEQRLRCRLLCPGLPTRWQGPREEWNSYSASLQGDHLPENTVMAATSEKDPAHIKETRILRRVGPRKVITKWCFFCWVSSVHQVFYSTTLQ